ncbi:MAG: tRNA uridine-5-carboxymethylaminomethyl(34) synthesis GTPase MnmE [Clostridia bacterium]|nr:tRNA uridine-5-carboxymethylaminomethyl(34) synthesis GTPase MnmE [Clostridia bacterium]
MKTIAAISTPAGLGGIGIVRISGNDALEITKKVFKPKKNREYKSHTIRYGYIIDENNNIVDEVLVSYFKAPNTYTGEDVCEINCHGGSISTKRILELVLKNGAVMAEAGEFTKKAFINGKMDLSQAEAVIDVINSKTEKENKASVNQLQGFLSKKINEIKQNVIDILVDIEANIDYPEYDIEEVKRENIEKTLEKSIEELIKLEKSFDSGKMLKEGITTAIVGKPNVGKSSLLNALLKEERAIVTEIPGTTRDTIEEYITIKGVPLKIIDTAGIRETTDRVEEIGVEKSKKILNEAQLVLILLDGTKTLGQEDLELLDLVKTKKYIVVINKIDVENKIDKTKIEGEIVEISAKTLEGLENLEKTIENMFSFNNIEVENEAIITSLRHKQLILLAREELEKTRDAVINGLPIDMLSIEIQNAIQHLGEITGEAVSEDVIKGIFSKFCVGK